MTLRFSKHFLRSYSKAPKVVRSAFDKQSLLLLQNLHHPSLRAKKYDEARDLWQARVNYAWRFYFRIVGDAYLLDEIRPSNNSEPAIQTLSRQHEPPAAVRPSVILQIR